MKKEVKVTLSNGKEYTVKRIPFVQLLDLDQHIKDKRKHFIESLRVCVIPEITQAEIDEMDPNDGFKLDSYMNHLNRIGLDFLAHIEADLELPGLTEQLMKLYSMNTSSSQKDLLGMSSANSPPK